MPDDDIKKLVDLIEAEVHRSRRSRRDLERALGLSHGYLGHLFSGRTEIKVRHILMLAEEVGFEPTALFNQAFGQPPGQPPGQPVGSDLSATPAAPLPPPMTEERVRDIARETIREELRRLVQPPATAEAPAAKV